MMPSLEVVHSFGKSYEKMTMHSEGKKSVAFESFHEIFGSLILRVFIIANHYR